MLLPRKTWPLLAALSLYACAPSRVAVKPGVDFSKIGTILIVEPERQDLRSITDEFARQLIFRGYAVRVGPEIKSGEADAVLQINVTQFTPDKKYLVQLNDDEKGSRDILVVNPVTEISGRHVYPSASAAGIEDAQIVVSNATVSLTARLLESAKREIWWSGAVTYEGLDLDAAVEGSVAALLKKFPGR